MSQGSGAGGVLHARAGALGSQPPPQSPQDHDRKVRRREKNRVAAQRSRKKQTQKADKLHEEHENLEQENSALRREIGALTEERQRLNEALQAHERRCPLLPPSASHPRSGLALLPACPAEALSCWTRGAQRPVDQCTGLSLPWTRGAQPPLTSTRDSASPGAQPPLNLT